MDWIILLVLIAAIIHTEWRYRKLKQAAHKDARAVASLFQSRISTIRMGQRSIQDPEVDFQPRTTRRDTPDIPATGRMSSAHVVHDGGDLHDSGSDSNS